MMMAHKKLLPLTLVLFCLKIAQIGAYEPVFTTDSEVPFVYPGPIGACLYGDKMGNFYAAVSSNEMAIALDTYSLAFLPSEQKKMEPLVAPKASINLDRAVEYDNPLYQKGIKHLALISKNDVVGMQSHVELPVVVTQDEPNVIYLYESSRPGEKTSLIKSQPVLDAYGNPAGDIVALTTGGGYVFAAVAPEGGVFGDPGSGITIMIRGFIKQIEPEGTPDAGKEKTMMTFNQLATAGLSSSSVPMYKNSEVLLHWDDLLQRLFITFKSGVANGAGIYSVFVARLTTSKVPVETEKKEVLPKKPQRGPKKKASSQPEEPKQDGPKSFPIFVMETLFPFDVLKSYAAHAAFDDVYVSGNADAISVMHTSTTLPYCVLGLRKEGSSYITAFPLAAGAEEVRGTVASAKENPFDTYQKWPKNRESFNARYLLSQITEDDSFPVVADTSVLVGGAPFEYAIKHLFVRGEGVFIVTDTGIFNSQAILDAWGRIKGWTRWEQLLFMSSDEILYDAALNAKSGTFILITGKTGFPDTIKRTAWVNNPLEPTDSVNKKGFTATCFDQQNLYFADDKKVVIYDIKTKSVTQTIEHSLGAIHAITLLSDQLESLFIGGRNGVALYTKNEAGLYDWHTVGAYEHVRKLVIDQGFLYVLTKKSLDRIKLNFNGGTVSCGTPVSLAGPEGSKMGRFGSFTDFIASGPLGLLATTKGLFRTSNGKSISLVSDQEMGAWQQVVIPEGLVPVLKLSVITQTRKEQDATVGSGSHLYVLTAYQGRNQAHINRFSIKSIQEGGVVAQDTVEQFHDYYLKDMPSHFIDICSMSTDFATDGACYFFIADYSGRVPAYVSLPWERYEPTVGMRFMGVRRSEMWQGETLDDHIVGMKIVPGMGWILATNTGLLTNG